MKINAIITLNLETRTKQLRLEGKSYEEIATVLSQESEQKITKSTVFRYFRTNDKVAAQIIENNDKLKAKVVETEIDTISKRVEIINEFLEIAKKAQKIEDFKAAVMALRGATEAQDSLDERLGKLKGSPTTNVNVLHIQEAVSSAREVLESRLSCIASRIGETGYSE